MKKLIFLLLFIYGCGTLKNTGSDARESTGLSLNQQSLKQQEEDDLDSAGTAISISSDTSSREFSAQIYPKGKVSYSPETGFSGFADKITIYGKSNYGSTHSSFDAAAKHKKTKRSTAIKQIDKATVKQSSQSKKSSPAWKWQLAGLLIVALAGWFVYKKLKNRFHL